MNLSPWFEIGTDGPPVRSGNYWFEIFIGDNAIHFMGLFLEGGNRVVTEDGRFIGLCYEDYWRGMLK